MALRLRGPLFRKSVAVAVPATQAAWASSALLNAVTDALLISSADLLRSIHFMASRLPAPAIAATPMRVRLRYLLSLTVLKKASPRALSSAASCWASASACTSGNASLMFCTDHGVDLAPSVLRSSNAINSLQWRPSASTVRTVRPLPCMTSCVSRPFSAASVRVLSSVLAPSSRSSSTGHLDPPDFMSPSYASPVRRSNLRSDARIITRRH